MFQDTRGPITWATDISNVKSNKHIDIRLHHIRQLLDKEEISTDAYVVLKGKALFEAPGTKPGISM